MDWGVTLSRCWCDRMDRQGLRGSVGAAQTRAGLLPGTDAGQTGHSNVDRCVERSRARSHGQARSRYTNTHCDCRWLSFTLFVGIFDWKRYQHSVQGFVVWAVDVPHDTGRLIAQGVGWYWYWCCIFYCCQFCSLVFGFCSLYYYCSDSVVICSEQCCAA